MYSKVFRSIYDGTLADNWQAMVTFQQLLILANEDGVVDMTLTSISRTTGIPMDILAAGVSVLEAPDEGSRTPDMEGRRIVRLDSHREWGWFLVNWSKYRKMTTREEKKESDRARIAESRGYKKALENKDVASCSNVSKSVAEVAYTDTDTDSKRNSPASAVRFREFWDVYPSKVAAGKCEKQWKLKRLDAIADKIISDVKEKQLKDGRWTEGYIPNPMTYINQERWNDPIIPRRGKAAQASAEVDEQLRFAK